MPFKIDEIKERFQKYGSIYAYDDIQEDVEDIIGLEEKKEMMEDFFLALKKYEEISSEMIKAKITPVFTMLLYGPPGTGKTALTRAMAKRHQIIMGLVEADRLVSPLLGDTVKNIRGVFDLASEIARENGSFVLFFDEIDAICSERANAHEVGEIKRAVISFLQIIDKVAYEGIPLAIFGATNHEHQLDSAVWRRFTYHLSFPFPNFIIRKQIIDSFLKRVEQASIGIDVRFHTDMEEEYNLIYSMYTKKKEKLGRELTDPEYYSIFDEIKLQGKAGILYKTLGYTGADLKRAMRVALFKAMQKSMLTYDDYFRSLEMVGGTETHVIQSKKLSDIGNSKISNSSKNQGYSGSEGSDTNSSQIKENPSLEDIDLDF
ncbi:AAA family ATPase [Candidatus Harpocratesius sp.]